jgi:hypothetical protein
MDQKQAGPQAAQAGKPRKKINWLKASIVANVAIIAVVAIGLGSMAVLRQSDTNPSFCGLCHVIQANVTSYLTSSNLDHVHSTAGVQCKGCHDYPVQAEIQSGIAFITKNYKTDGSGQLASRKFVAQQTDFLARNPHDSHNGQLPCSSCHVAHGTQIDYCAQCHDNGGQRMIGQPITDRGTVELAAPTPEAATGG